MRIKNIETWFVCMFLFLEIASFISFAFPIRFIGQNMLNHRLWAYLVLIMFFFTDSKTFFSKSMLIVYLYIGIYLIFEAMGHYDLQANRSSRLFWLTQQHIPLLMAVALSERYHRVQIPAQLVLILKVSMLALIIASLASIAIIIRYPQAVRGNEMTIDLQGYDFYRRQGLAGIDFFSGLPFLIPVFFYWYKKSTKRRKFYWFSMILLLLTCIYMGAVVAPLIASLMLFFLSYLGRKRFANNKWLMFILLLVILAIPKYIISDLLVSIGQLSGNSEIRTKFTDMGMMFSDQTDGFDTGALETSSNSIERRFARVPSNFRSILKSPFIGVGKLEAGTEGNEHIFWLNLFAQFGIIGAFPLIWLFYYNIKRNLARFDDEFKYYYLLSIFGFIAFGFMKVLVGWFMYAVVFFLVPYMHYFSRQEVKN